MSHADHVEGEASPTWPLRVFASSRFIDFVFFEFFVNFVGSTRYQRRREFCVVTR